MSYSLSNAAAACSVYKSTVLRSIKSGRLTATKDALGQWRIEPAELHRVYPPAQSNGADGNGTRHGATAALIEAQHRAELAEQRLADLKAVFEDMRQDREPLARARRAPGARRRAHAAAVAEALSAGPASFLDLMAALGSKDGREIVRELDALYAAQRLARQDDGRYVLKSNTD